MSNAEAQAMQETATAVVAALENLREFIIELDAELKTINARLDALESGVTTEGSSDDV